MSGTGPGPAHAAALAGLPGMTPVRLARLLADGDPSETWARLVEGPHRVEDDRGFAASARRTDPIEVGEEYARAGVAILMPGGPGYPTPLAGDPGAPAVLFARGDTAVLEDRRRVAIVGTRSATPYGRKVASELGRQLAADGVVVVSGLARGIDGAAHAGAVRASADDPGRPVAVVGTGVDVVYPASNRALWEQVASDGVVLSESPLGTAPLHGCSRPETGSSPPWWTWWWWSSATTAAVPSSPPRRRPAGVSRCAPYPARCRAVPRRGPTGSWSTGAPRSGTPPTCWWPSRWPGRGGVRRPRRSRRPAWWRPEAATAIAQATTDGDARMRTVATPSGPTFRRAARSGRCSRRWRTSRHRSRTILLRTTLAIPEAVDACHRLVAEGRLRSGAGWWSRR